MFHAVGRSNPRAIVERKFLAKRDRVPVAKRIDDSNVDRFSAIVFVLPGVRPRVAGDCENAAVRGCRAAHDRVRRIRVRLCIVGIHDQRSGFAVGELMTCVVVEAPPTFVT